MQLSGKRALVIGGGGGGIGRAVTEAFGNEGAAVVVADLDPGRAEEAAEAVRQRGGTAYPVSGDVRSPADIEAMVAGAVEKLGGLDVLVTVVGGQVAFVPAVKLHEMADEDWTPSTRSTSATWCGRSARCSASSWSRVVAAASSASFRSPDSWLLRSRRRTA